MVYCSIKNIITAAYSLRVFLSYFFFSVCTSFFWKSHFFPHCTSSLHFPFFIIHFGCLWKNERKNRRREKNYVLFYYHIEKSLNLLSSSHCVVMFFLLVLTKLAFFSSFHLYCNLLLPNGKEWPPDRPSGNDCILFWYWIFSIFLFFVPFRAENKIKSNAVHSQQVWMLKGLVCLS